MLAVKLFDPGTISLSTCFQSHERRKESVMLLNSGFSILKRILFRVAQTKICNSEQDKLLIREH